MEGIYMKLVKLMEENDELWTAAAALKRDTNISLAFESLIASIEVSCQLNDDFIKKAINELKRMGK